MQINIKNRTNLRLNRDVRSNQVELISLGVDEKEKSLTLLTKSEALEIAESKGLDLVEMNVRGNVSVCKIFDYGKYEYEKNKKKREARKKQKVSVLKSLSMSMRIGKHDYQVRLKQMAEWLLKGDKIKLAIKLRGRELAYTDRAVKMLYVVQDELAAMDVLVKLDQPPKLEGRDVVVIFVLAPTK